MVGLIILIVSMVVAYFAWKFVSKHFMNKGHKKVISNLAGIGVGFLAFMIVLIALIPEQSQIKGKAHTYIVVNEDDYSFSGRDRKRWIISSPKALTKEDRALTTIQAAKDLQNKTNADQVNIFLVIDGLKNSYGIPLAIVTYTPDGQGNSGDKDSRVWEVESSDKILKPLEKDITLAWYQHKKDFIQEDGLTDEVKLSKFIADKLNITVDQISLPWINRTKIDYK